MEVLCVFLALACGYDYRYHKIPNYLLMLTVVFGVGWRLGTEGIPGAVIYAGGSVLIMCLAYPLFKIGAVGAGDVKLLGAAAGYLQFGKIPVFCIISLLIAAVISLIKMVRKRNFLERMKYLADYLKNVANSGRWKLYQVDERDKMSVSVCLSGPILVSILLYIGGRY